MQPKFLSIIGAAVAIAAGAASIGAQNRPKLHVNPRWKQCSIQLDSSLKQSAWHQFTVEAGQVVYFRPLTDAQPLGRGKFEFSLMQWQTNVDDKSSAWNDTFVHPDSTHWLYEGNGLQFPGLAARAGITSTTDAGLYFTKNFQANYGAYGMQVQQNLLGGAARDWELSARASFMSLFGPADVDLKVYGVDVVASLRRWKLGPTTIAPYAGVATYLAASHEKSPVVKLADVRAVGTMGTLGAATQVSVVRIAAEASIARVPSIAIKFGVGR